MRIIIILILTLLIPNQSIAVDWTPMQKIWRGMVEEKTVITCRLAKRKVIKNQKVCIFVGANNTNETIFIDKFEHCPASIQCVYEPEKEKPNILEMMESLEESLSK